MQSNPILVGSGRANQHLPKDQAKSDKATKFIGFGVPGSSTYQYAQAWGTRANSGIYTSVDKVFVSVNGGNNANNPSNLSRLKAELDLAIAANVVFITDNAYDRNRPYNVGERIVESILLNNNYEDTDNGIWKSKSKSKSNQENNMTNVRVEIVEQYTVEMAKADSDRIYVFGDNLIGKGFAGQACIRNEPNAMGIPTKKLPAMTDNAFFNDAEFGSNVNAIQAAIDAIRMTGKDIVFPAAGIGTGLAMLPQKAPRTWDYLVDALNNQLNIDITTNPCTAVNQKKAGPSGYIQDTRHAYETYTAKQWLLIDLASKHGMDKETYSARLTWGREVLEEIRMGSDCQHHIETAKEPALFAKALIAIKDVLAGHDTGHVVGLDAAASGPQLLSILLHCLVGMMNTGALNVGKVPDLYTTIYKNMVTARLNLTRDEVKDATIPYVYGSDLAPKLIFGDDAPAFIEAYNKTVPLAAMFRTIMLEAWNESALSHEFAMPDGALVFLENRINDDFKGEMLGYTFKYRCAVNRPMVKGEKGTRSLVANVTHACDGFVVRELNARCTYNRQHIEKVVNVIKAELQFPDAVDLGEYSDLELHRMQALWVRFEFTSVATLDKIDTRNSNLGGLSTEFLRELLEKAEWMLEYKPFDTFTIHDEFKCSPNHVERMRQVYNSIIAELYKSRWLLEVMGDLTGDRFDWTTPVDEEIYQALLNSNYAIG